MLLINKCEQHRFSYFQPISLQVTENPQGHNFICTLWLWSIDKCVFSLKKLEEKSTFDETTSWSPLCILPICHLTWKENHRLTRNGWSRAPSISTSFITLRTASFFRHIALFMYFIAYIFFESRFCTIHTWK